VMRLASPLAVLAVWEFIARAGLVDPFIVPAPTAVFAELWKLLWTLELPAALAVSLRRIAIGFGLSVVISVVIGMLMARIPLVEILIDPLVELIRPVSPLAIFPLAILWFGIGETSKVFLIALACAFPVILNTYAGVRSIDVSYVRVARSLGATNAEILLRVILPGCLPQVFTGVRIAWGIALIVIIAAEMIGGSAGIGYMILDAQQTFRVDRVFAGIIAIGVLGYVTDLGFRLLRRKLLPWYREIRE